MHRRVEASFDLDSRCGSVAAYRALLEDLLSLYRPLERALAGIAWTSSGLDYGSRRKVALLESDLLDLDRTARDLAALPDVAAEWLPTTLADGFGTLYVIEGSTLGGRIILQRLRPLIGVGPDWAGRFFNGYGLQTGAMWRSFVAALNGWPAKRDEVDAAERAAVATFANFEAVFTASRAASKSRELSPAGASPWA